MRARPGHALAVVLVVALSAACVLLFHRQAHALVDSLLGELRRGGPWVFFLAMAILPAFGFPLLPFALMAGPAFNPVFGAARVTAFALAAVAFNVALTYVLSRHLLGRFIHGLLERLGYRLPELPAGTSWQVVLGVRLAPGLPFWSQSYLLGLIGVPWIPYIVISTAVPSVYLAATIALGSAAWDGHLRAALLAFALVGCFACALSVWRTMLARAPVRAE